MYIKLYLAIGYSRIQYGIYILCSYRVVQTIAYAGYSVCYSTEIRVLLAFVLLD